MECEQFDFIVCAVVIGFLCVCGIIGNVTSILVLWKHRAKTATLLLLQCLSAADSILLITTLFVYSLPAFFKHTGLLKSLHDSCQHIMVYMWPVAMMAHTATIWFTVLVTLHRFFSVCKPLGVYVAHYKFKVRAQVLVVFSLSVVFNIPRFFEHYEISGDLVVISSNSTGGNVTSRPMILGDNFIYQVIYSNILYYPVMYIIPLISLTYLSSRLITALNGIRSKKITLTGQRPPEDHITVCIIIIVFVFILCQTPALINQILWAVTGHLDRECGKFHFYYTKISDVLVVMNSSVNFIVFCLFGKSFRDIFVRSLCGNMCISGIRERVTSSFRTRRTTVQHSPIPLQDM